MTVFNGFSASDFAAYEERKQGSNAFTLERIKVKEKFQALQGHVAPRFAAAEFAAHLSDEFPSIVNHKKVDAQWLYYTRSAQQAAELAKFLEKTELKPDKIFNLAPQDKHLALALVLNREQVQIGLLAHAGAWVDRKNFAAKLDQSWNREKLKQLLGSLDSELRLGFEQETVPAHDMELEAIASLADMLVNDERRFVLWRTLTAEQALGHGAAFIDVLAQTFDALLGAYQFIAWSRDNDHIQVGEKLQKQKADQRKNATELKIGDRVRVLGGLFAGKVGAVQSIDRLQVRVQVGPLAVNIASTDLTKA